GGWTERQRSGGDGVASGRRRCDAADLSAHPCPCFFFSISCSSSYVFVCLDGEREAVDRRRCSGGHPCGNSGGGTCRCRRRRPHRRHYYRCRYGRLDSFASGGASPSRSGCRRRIFHRERYRGSSGGGSGGGGGGRGGGGGGSDVRRARWLQPQRGGRRDGGVDGVRGCEWGYRCRGARCASASRASGAVAASAPGAAGRAASGTGTAAAARGSATTTASSADPSPASAATGLEGAADAPAGGTCAEAAAAGGPATGRLFAGQEARVAAASSGPAPATATTAAAGKARARHRALRTRASAATTAATATAAPRPAAAAAATAASPPTAATATATNTASAAAAATTATAAVPGGTRATQPRPCRRRRNVSTPTRQLQHCHHRRRHHHHRQQRQRQRREGLLKPPAPFFYPRVPRPDFGGPVDATRFTHASPPPPRWVPSTPRRTKRPALPPWPGSSRGGGGGGGRRGWTGDGRLDAGADGNTRGCRGGDGSRRLAAAAGAADAGPFQPRWRLLRLPKRAARAHARCGGDVGCRGQLVPRAAAQQPGAGKRRRADWS
ncbi:unnamed protein product, partial [Laminaria digitata]